MGDGVSDSILQIQIGLMFSKKYYKKWSKLGRIVCPDQNYTKEEKAF